MFNRPADADGGLFDMITGLPNRRSFRRDHADRAALAAAGPLMLITLSTAQHYNQLLRVLGHDAADHFVAQGARRLRDAVPAACGPIYHVSVMSFAFSLPPGSTLSPDRLAEALYPAFSDPVSCNDIPVDLSPGIGLLDTARRAFDPAEALRAAMTAAQASRTVEAPYRWYDRDTDDAFKRSFTLLTDLRKALSDSPEELALHFQPRVSLKSGECRSAEALLRWQHPTMGSISPAEFIPLAEATALIKPLTGFVLERSIATLADWRRAGLPLSMSANMSPFNLGESDFVSKTLDLLARSGIEKGGFELEFTEGVFDGDRSLKLARLNELVAAGVEIAIDDFGSGYSNFSYLADLPASILKIDQSFIRPMDDDPQKQRLVRTIIALARGFNYRIVGEGIETARSMQSLKDWDCDEGQGYHIARPLRADHLGAWLAAR